MIRIALLVIVLVLAPTAAFFLWAWGVKIMNERKLAGTLPEWQEHLLRSVLVNEKAVEQVRNDIFVHLCNIPDHTGARVGFIEKVTEKHANCIAPERGDKPVAHIRKRRGLKQTYNDKTVDGIILHAKHTVLRTHALIVDAVLGQGEALDCYNQHLQEAAVEGAHLTNRKQAQAIGVVDGISDPAEKARLYNHVFGTCCPVAQTPEAPE